MATEKVAMLREEMGRCMQELEAELLGLSFGAKKGGDFLGQELEPRKHGRSGDGEEGGLRRNPRQRIDNGEQDVYMTEAGSSKPIWDAVVDLLKTCISVPAGDVDVDTNSLLSVLERGGFNTKVLKNLNQSINFVILKADAMLVSPNIDYYRQCLIRQERLNFGNFCRSVEVDMINFVSLYNECLRQHMGGTVTDMSLLAKTFSDCNMNFENLMMISNGRDNELCNASLMITRNTMHMATQLLQFSCMLKLFERRSSGN
jgi:hypothetical protein